jgi:glycosyltransferase involved in cell wall biosynthesis
VTDIQPIRAIHQFHSGTAVGDAITDQMLMLRSALQALGVESQVYAEHVAPELADEILPSDRLISDPETGLLLHHSMGNYAFPRVLSLGLRTVGVYHNITPPRFFDNAELRSFIRLGQRQLRTLGQASAFGIAVSNHNRKEMYAAGFLSVDVIPVKSDYSKFRAVREQRGHVGRDWLFVGRVVPNKRQLELVRAFAVYHRTFDRLARLVLVGDLSYGPYVAEVRREAARLGVSDAVHLAGKLHESDLLAHYRDAGTFVCLSEHEGFGVPLLEAMAAALPVLACDEAAVGETLGGAGVLLRTTDAPTVAAAAHIFASDHAIRANLIAHQDRRLKRLEQFDLTSALQRVIRRLEGHPVVPTVQIQGPFETSYSLATLNRELALQLNSLPEVDVSIWTTEGPGDYEPSAQSLLDHPVAAALHVRGRSQLFPDVAVRQMYPPRVHDSTAALTFQYFGWEESLIPAKYALDFNRYLTGMGVMSNYVAEVVERSGVTVPVSVAGVGVIEPETGVSWKTPELTGLKSCRFLHISSAFPRKGVDVLLEAYFAEFTGDDEVSLILKTSPNPHNMVGPVLDRLMAMRANPPDVRWIDRDLTRSEVGALYGLASAYVHPARGEGFGLPVAEAMLARVPVIATANTGLADFVSDETAAVIPSTEAIAATHLSVDGSTWFEPDPAALAVALRSLARKHDSDIRSARVEAAQALIESQFSWKAVAARWVAFIDSQRLSLTRPLVAAVTTYNSRCGIAAYTHDLRSSLTTYLLEIHADREVTPLDESLEPEISRSWVVDIRHRVDELLRELASSPADVVHVQYNFGFFGVAQLQRIIEAELPKRPVVVTLHRTTDLELADRVVSLSEISSALNTADAIIVHQQSDVERLASFGVTGNVHLIPIGCDDVVDVDRTESRRQHDVPAHRQVIGTFGFLLPHKGTHHLIDALALLVGRNVDAHLLVAGSLHPDPSSQEYLEVCRRHINDLGVEDRVTMVTDYLSVSDARAFLSAADVLALPYAATNESSSAALRFMLPLSRPLIVTRLPIFEDASQGTVQIEHPVNPVELADQIERLLLDGSARQAATNALQAVAEMTNWSLVAQTTERLFDDVRKARTDRNRRS